MRLWQIFIGGLTVGAVLSGRCEVKSGAVVVPPPKEQPGAQALFAETVAQFDVAAKSATSTEIFEGLPHPFEKELLASEKKRTSTRKLHGELFYAKVQSIDLTAAGPIREALSAAVRPYGGLKFCGGFHADYAIRWRTPAGVYEALICFGCHEAKLFTPRGALTTDLSQEGYKVLQALLTPFRKERPERQVIKASN